jgi:hypothetical protein
MTDQKKPPGRGRKKPGRKPVEGIDKRKFLATMESDVIKGLKLAAIQKNTTASMVLEQAAEEWLERWRSKAKKT